MRRTIRSMLSLATAALVVEGNVGSGTENSSLETMRNGKDWDGMIRLMNERFYLDWSSQWFLRGGFVAIKLCACEPISSAIKYGWGQSISGHRHLQPTGLQPSPLQYSMASSPLKTVNLQARYRSPNAEKIFCNGSGVSGEKPSKQPSTVEKAAYLATLRLSVAKLQDDVNAFLTQRMDEDKAAAAVGFVDMGKGKIQADDEQEENYGEEDANEDD
ncbi:MAG: hypothetical protein M1840_004802 [Geoglossum simile]|nr:MAG: hypothetical protein M1840_004802 [Geoglossum simile]